MSSRSRKRRISTIPPATIDETDDATIRPEIRQEQRLKGEFLRQCDRFMTVRAPGVHAHFAVRAPDAEEPRRLAQARAVTSAMLADVFGGTIHPSTLACALTQTLAILAGFADVECVEADSPTRLVTGLDLVEAFSRHIRASYHGPVNWSTRRVRQN